MLQDPIFETRDRELAYILASLGSAPKRVRCGVYDGCGYNFSNNLRRGSFEDFSNNLPDDVPGYGVGDSIDQVLALYAEKLENAPGAYAIGFTRVDRADQPPRDGWRWHKWGEYVGTKKPQCEYLADEPDIEFVYTFTIVELKAHQPRLFLGTVL